MNATFLSTSTPMSVPYETLDVAPINPAGPLPRGLTPNLLRRAFESGFGKSVWTVRSLLRELGIGPVADSNGCRIMLREALDDPENRKRLELVNAGLPQRLWLHAQRQPSGRRVYKALFEQAEYKEGNKVYLNPERFADVVSSFSPADRDALCKTEECAVLVLAFGLLQSDDALSLVQTLLEAAPEHATFFSGPSERQEASSDDATDSPEDVEPPPVAADGHLRQEDPFLEGTQAVLREIGECQRALLGAVTGARYDDLPGLHMALDRARRGLVERLRQKEKELGVGEGSLPIPSPPSVTTAQGIAIFTQELAAEITLAAEKGVKMVASERERYAKELKALSLAPPQALEAAGTLAQIEELRQHDAGRVREARFRRSLRGRGDAPETVHEGVAPARRLQIYFEESLRAGADPARLKQWLVADQAAARSSPRESVQELTSAVLGSLRRNATLPSGLWALAGELDFDVFRERLADPELAGLIASRTPEDVCGGELSRVLAPTVGTLHRSLQRFLRRSQSLDVDVAERATILANLALEEPTDKATALELLQSLATAGRQEELWLLSDALVRAEVLAELPEELRAALLGFVAERAAVDGPHLVMLGDLVDNDDWVGDDIDALTVLLFLAVRTDKGRLVLFRHSAQLGSLQAARPHLLDRWLRPKLERVASRLEDAELARSWGAGHQAVLDWGREIQKRSCFQALRFAEDYQRAIRARLETVLAAALAGTPPPPLDPEELLEEIQVEQDLPPVKNPARLNMSDYVREQWARLTAIAEAIVRCEASYADLVAHPTPPDRQELAAEAERERVRSPQVASVYRYALGGFP
jgi:hypothetical protein